MIKNMAVIDEGAHGLRIAEIHAQGNARIGAFTCPARDGDGVSHVRRFQGDAIDGHHHEMYLVYVKSVNFFGLILDGPILYRTLRGNDGWRYLLGWKNLGFCPWTERTEISPISMLPRYSENRGCGWQQELR